MYCRSLFAKSNFGDYYELNIKIFIQGMFGNMCTRSKDLVKKMLEMFLLDNQVIILMFWILIYQWMMEKE